jgi:adenylate cyclase
MIDNLGMQPPAEPCLPTVLLVDDIEANRKMLRTLLSLTGYRVVEAVNGQDALEKVASDSPDLVLLDIVMPLMDGYEACRLLREDERTRFLPVVMITASGDQEKVKALEAGADDFIMKPFNQSELLARVKSLVRIKQFHDTIQAQAAQLAQQAGELAQWNQRLEQRVRDQVHELERVGRLRRFLSPQLADIIISSGDESTLDSHRREVAVVFCDLRGFTAFSANNEPEEVMHVLRDYHAAMGEIVFRHGGTLERFAGDGMMVFFNDPIPCDDFTARAVHMAVDMRQRVNEMAPGWQKRGYDLGFGVGIAQGYATLGKVGFEGRLDYAAIGSVTNLASRLSDEAQAGQILINQRAFGAVESLVRAEPAGELTLKGFAAPVPAFNVIDLKL